MQRSSKGRTDWKSLDGAAEKIRRLRLVKANDGLFHFPLIHCDHDGFYSQRDCRRHVRNHHDWFYYFDKKPEIKDLPSKIEAVVQKKGYYFCTDIFRMADQYSRWGSFRIAS